MRYVGGKQRIAGWVKDHCERLRTSQQTYLEPFVGAGSVFALNAPLYKRVIAGDAHPDLIAMWRAIARGWTPPEHVSRRLYEGLRRSKVHSPLRGFAGFGASFGGKWFGGYVDCVWDKHHSRYTASYAAAARRSLLCVARTFKRAMILNVDYRQHAVTSDMLVYCDIPYKGTIGYRGTPPFDVATFWQVARRWAERDGALVVVSEMTAPKDWVQVASRTRKAMLRVSRGVENEVRPESLYVHRSWRGVR
jgi:DNA adenine methylase